MGTHFFLAIYTFSCNIQKAFIPRLLGITCAQGSLENLTKMIGLYYFCPDFNMLCLILVVLSVLLCIIFVICYTTSIFETYRCSNTPFDASKPRCEDVQYKFREGEDVSFKGFKFNIARVRQDKIVDTDDDIVRYRTSSMRIRPIGGNDNQCYHFDENGFAQPDTNCDSSMWLRVNDKAEDIGKTFFGGIIMILRGLPIRQMEFSSLKVYGCDSHIHVYDDVDGIPVLHYPGECIIPGTGDLKPINIRNREAICLEGPNCYNGLKYVDKCINSQGIVLR